MKQAIRVPDRIFDRILLLVFLLMFCIGGYSVFDTWMIYNHAQDTDLLKYKPHVFVSDVEVSNVFLENEVAWLTVDDTQIDYPVMQGKDNSEYLNKDPYGEYSLAGSLFLDVRNHADFSDEYSLIYGHHMEHGIMFGALDAFLDEDYFNAHRTGSLTFSDGSTLEIRFFACLEADASVPEIFAPNTGYDAMSYIRSNALIWNRPDGETLLALSTCKFPETADRIIVVGSLHEPSASITNAN